MVAFHSTEKKDGNYMSKICDLIYSTQGTPHLVEALNSFEKGFEY